MIVGAGSLLALPYSLRLLGSHLDAWDTFVCVFLCDSSSGLHFPPNGNVIHEQKFKIQHKFQKNQAYRSSIL